MQRTAQGHAITDRWGVMQAMLEPGQVHCQHLLVQIQQRRLGLILCGRRNLPIDRQMAQKRFHLGRPHVLRVALAMKENKTPCPVDISLFRANAVVPRAQVNAHALQQLGRAWLGGATAGLLGCWG